MQAHDRVNRPPNIQLPLNPAPIISIGKFDPSLSNNSPGPPSSAVSTMKSSYVPLTPATSDFIDPSSSTGGTRKPTLTAWQSYAHAFGPSSAQTRFNLPPTPPAPTPEVSSLSAITESSCATSKHQPSRPQPSRRHSKRDRSASAVSTGTSSPVSPARRSSSRSYFDWTPGSQPTPIYDPDYPDGTPECLSPRIEKSPESRHSGGDYFCTSSQHHRSSKHKAPRFNDNDVAVIHDGDGGPGPSSTSDKMEPPLAMSELHLVHPYIGIMEDVFGEWVFSPIEGRTSRELWLDMDKARREKARARRKEGKSLSISTSSEPSTLGTSSSKSICSTNQTSVCESKP
ncbi:hypothetical protein FRB96_007142 [Tulasnella sp. 330]|nr:hypothetical protein FRB96_007142 [Tulasnella sp. 330]